MTAARECECRSDLCVSSLARLNMGIPLYRMPSDSGAYQRVVSTPPTAVLERRSRPSMNGRSSRPKLVARDSDDEIDGMNGDGDKGDLLPGKSPRISGRRGLVDDDDEMDGDHPDRGAHDDYGVAIPDSPGIGRESGQFEAFKRPPRPSSPMGFAKEMAFQVRRIVPPQEDRM
jgi:hypothetical protein